MTGYGYAGLLATTTVSLSGVELLIEDKGSPDNRFVLTTNGSDLTIRDLNGNTIDLGTVTGTGHGTDTVLIDFSEWTGGIIVNAAGGDDSLEIDYTGSSNFDNRAITYNGGTQNTSPNGDSLTLTGGSFTDATYAFTNENDGSVQLSGQGLITYTGLEPITSTITATDVFLNYGMAEETITVTSGGAGKTTVSSTLGETTTFNDPAGP